jgi:hypothetical protein
MSTPNRYASAGRLGALVKWGRTIDRAAATEAARKAAEDRWLREVRAEHPDLDDKTARLMADARKRAYFSRLAIKSAAARARRAA